MANYSRNVAKVEPSLTSAQGKNLRQSERVFLTLPIRIRGVGEYAKEFLDEGHTVDVSRDGATIMVDRELRLGQNIKIQRIGTSKEAQARVIGQIVRKSAGLLYGVTLVDPTVNLWDISFPAVCEADKAVLRTLLSCIACGQTEVSYLNEFETDLFLYHRSIARICRRCGGWTTWTQPQAQFPALHSALEKDSQRQRLGHILAPGARNQRSHHRIRADAIGSVRHPTLGTEVVLVGNLARGGLSFYSTSTYAEGSSIEMAIPYTSRAPNIYVSARIVNSRKGEDTGFIEYGVSYIL
jgi:PilZ domain